MSARDPALVRLIAGRYRELQGLSTIADAGFPLICAAGYYLLSEEWHALILGAVLAFYLWARFSWLRRRFDDCSTMPCCAERWKPSNPPRPGSATSGRCLGAGAPAR